MSATEIHAFLYFMIFQTGNERRRTIMTKEIMTAITGAVGEQVFGIWFLIGAALVFFMQAGFAMVEAGFTRAKFYVPECFSCGTGCDYSTM